MGGEGIDTHEAHVVAVVMVVSIQPGLLMEMGNGIPPIAYIIYCNTKKYPPLKTNMTLESPPFEDVFPNY